MVVEVRLSCEVCSVLVWLACCVGVGEVDRVEPVPSPCCSMAALLS